MQRLIVIRHAQSEHHVRGLTGGWTDTALSEQGRAQAELLARRCGQRFGEETDLHLYSSDLARAAETAGFLSRALGVPVQLEPALREMNNGIAAGLSVEEARRLELPATEPAAEWVPYPGAESWRRMTERVFAGMSRIEERCPGTALVVTHGNAGIAVIQWWLRLCQGCRAGISFDLDPASISVFELNAWQERTITSLNDTAHLAAIEAS